MLTDIKQTIQTEGRAGYMGGGWGGEGI